MQILFIENEAWGSLIINLGYRVYIISHSKKLSIPYRLQKLKRSYVYAASIYVNFRKDNFVVEDERLEICLKSETWLVQTLETLPFVTELY